MSSRLINPPTHHDELPGAEILQIDNQVARVSVSLIPGRWNQHVISSRSRLDKKKIALPHAPIPHRRRHLFSVLTKIGNQVRNPSRATRANRQQRRPTPSEGQKTPEDASEWHVLSPTVWYRRGGRRCPLPGKCRGACHRPFFQGRDAMCSQGPRSYRMMVIFYGRRVITMMSECHNPGLHVEENATVRKQNQRGLSESAWHVIIAHTN